MDDRQPSQRWKRDLLAAAGIAPPDALIFVGVDLPSAPVLVSWLGVSMYLTGEAVAANLAAVGRQAAGAELVIEDALPAALWRRSDALGPLGLCRLARAVVARHDGS